MSSVPLDSVETFGSARLRASWAEHDLVPLWEGANSSVPPNPERARLWRWSEMRPIMLETIEIASPSVIERRVLQLVNKTIPNASAEASAGLLNATLQGLRPGEKARPHRHTINALRFVLEGGGAETIVNGKPCPMETGDLITTPGMAWHEHRHNGDRPTLWLDILDVHLHLVLRTAAFQPGPAGALPATYADSAFATANIVPYIDDAEASRDSPVFRYPWRDVEHALRAVPARDDGSKLVRYINPLTGGPVMTLIDCYVLELPGGTDYACHQTNASAVVSVVEGSGTSHVNDATLHWDAHDTLAIPQMAHVAHRAGAGGARLFIATNHELFKRLQLSPFGVAGA